MATRRMLDKMLFINKSYIWINQILLTKDFKDYKKNSAKIKNEYLKYLNPVKKYNF